MQTNHIAILVRNLEAVSASLPQACTLHPPEDQPTEGTREQHVTLGSDSTPALLLIQAIANGPYTRAFKKRGPGLHHIGCVCENIEDELLAGQRQHFLLHPVSLRTRKFGVVWLCRPGVPYLVELMENTGQSAIKHEEVQVTLPAGSHIPQCAHGLVSIDLTKG